MTFLTSSVEPLSLVNIANYSPGAAFGPRVIASFEFVWVLEGSAIWSILGADGEAVETHLLGPGVVALSSIGSSERYDWDQNQASSHAFVHFELPAGIDTSRWPRTRTVSDYPLLGALADSLFDLAATDESTARGRSSQVIGLMLDVFLAGPISGLVGRAPRATDRAIAYVRTAWSTSGMRIVAIAEIAGALNISPGHLSRSFRDRFGIGPASAFELVRLARAAVALQRTSSTLAEIAAECGFTDEYHLSRRFSRLYGSPPGAYRRRHPDTEPLAPIIERRLMTLWNTLVTGATARSRVGRRLPILPPLRGFAQLD